MIDSEYIPYPNPDVLCQNDGEGWAVLVNMDTGNSIAVNAAGKFIWKAADGAKDVCRIIYLIKEAFTDVPGDIDHDVLELVDQLKANGFFGSKVNY